VAPDLTLILDLSVGGFVAVLDASDGVLSHRWKTPEARHDALGDWVEECLREAGASFPDLREICVGVGPGSFTGLRIAMAFAQGLALPRGLQTHGFSSFAPLHLSAAIPANLDPSAPARVAVIPAQAGKYYVSRGLGDAGKLLDTDALKSLGAGGAAIAVHAEVPALASLRSAFGRLFAVGGNWDGPAVARRARASGLGADKPLYLALSAAEAKAGEAGTHAR